MKRITFDERRKPSIFSGIKNSSRTVRFISFGMILLLIILFVEIWVVNRTTTYGDKIFQLKQQQADLELENQVLSNAIASASAMALLEQKANQLGFNTINQVDYIKSSPNTLASAK